MITADHAITIDQSSISADLSSVAEDLKHELESLLSLLEFMDFGKRMKSWHLRPAHSAIRPGYNAKTYNQKTVNVEEDRIISLPVFTFEIELSSDFKRKSHFMQFQQYSNGLWKDYALILMTDQKVGLVDLSTNSLLKTVETPFPVNELYVQNADESLQSITEIVETGRDILEDLHKGLSYPVSELIKIVQHLGTIHLGILHRTGSVGFFSGVIPQENERLEPQIMLGSFDLSKVKDGTFEVMSSKNTVYLDPELPLKKSVSMDLSTPGGFTVVEKTIHQF